MWMSHWGLTRDPFAELESPYVSLPSHDEAVARLVFAVDSSQHLAVVAAPEGLGKTAVLRKARAELLDPHRQFVSVSCPRDGGLLFTLLAERLGQRVAREPSRPGAWRALERAIRVATLQGVHIVAIIEDCDGPVDATVRRDLESLSRLGSIATAGLTIIRLERLVEDTRLAAGTGWPMNIGLQRLTRSEVGSYLTAKAQWAGSAEGLFTPRAITRIHSLSFGVPRKLEQLARACLVAGAARGLEVINPELVDAVADEPCAGTFATSA
jgi:MSHA biogenesis protein MshM